jgi:hypothetical protein
MSETQHEFLVILSDPAVRKTIEQRARITQTISDRVFVASGEQPSGGPALRVLTGGEEAADLPADLSSSEALFVNGWLLGRKAKTRKGENLAWDTPGFQPPDRNPKG